ncbi:regulator of G-protein signaling 18 isoform X1 [Poecile atricapillus]|uniref:regulator of G-protein signaling 18 isoform X1 n=1 Tax=Poecile atricapillus TaxID=48891 RepID=UPI00273A06A3|nr:regulator of G-protein signaling 18 isoform X1 [Poecile atricapillus]
MENPLLLFPQLNISASEDKAHFRAMRSAGREEPQKGNTGAKQKRNRLSLLLQRPEFHAGDHLGKPGSLTKAASSVSPEEAVKWGESFDKLLSEKAGLEAFTKFLKTEFSEENIEFWIACEDYKKSKSAQELLPKAKTIFETFIQKDAPKEVNLDWHTREVTRVAVGQPGRGAFEAAQRRVFALMEQDSYRRFLRSAAYLSLLRGHSRSCRV